MHISHHLQGGVIAVHAPGKIRSSAKGLLVDKIPPSADSLANEKSQGGQIQHSWNIQLSDLRHDAPENQRAYNAAVDSQPAGMNIKDFQGILPVFVPRIENHIKQARTDNTANQPHNDGVEKLIEVDIHLFRAARRIDQRQQKTHGNNDAVPLHFKTADRKRRLIDGKRKPQLWKFHLVCHCTVLPSLYKISAVKEAELQTAPSCFHRKPAPVSAGYQIAAAPPTHPNRQKVPCL